MHIVKALGSLCAAFALAATGAAHAGDTPTMNAQVMRINKEWARIKYRVPDRKDQYTQLDQLATQAAQLAAKYPGHAEPLLWEGIVTSEEAAQASMLKKMGLASSARDILEKAYKIDPMAGKGGVAMSLGVLYYKVPGWPIGFGSSAKARKYLEQALSADPNGLDANWFYGDYWASQGDKKKARTYFNKALAAPADPNRPVWDAGRRAEVRDALAKL